VLDKLFDIVGLRAAQQDQTLILNHDLKVTNPATHTLTDARFDFLGQFLRLQLGRRTCQDVVHDCISTLLTFSAAFFGRLRSPESFKPKQYHRNQELRWEQRVGGRLNEPHRTLLAVSLRWEGSELLGDKGLMLADQQTLVAYCCRRSG